MDINEKMLMELAGKVGVKPGGGQDLRRAEQMAGQMQGKNETEILKEILTLKDTIKKDPAAYQKQLAAIRALRGMMNQDQRSRLDRVLQMLEE